ncbi:hypothetical protein CKN73_03800 [Carnobacterium divergens]|uniref:helix-turn-helix domain-containing protein n=1 Tax=Carnobacterium divergens TaxID=2748 RepID=UPI0010725DAF|nr:helix-turn-helix domain-containing protein [Carnobacterium divergens]TFJ42677.1 hypothetical protein CKN77_03730 [Carnobacterium divergens]TFJ51217.1 hypothetical protein CKN73_03800 [Carnobacterium divergens]TFJ56214.1 hypothetical protein CKN83_03745 [Carnobacterium divergens]TFJ63751.1 hypothetical protein CKN89_03825 [Carnobacterium divergens]TFJ72910.1 hypothetical protein CKN91_03750 [Carnobacterium divergens]
MEFFIDKTAEKKLALFKLLFFADEPISVKEILTQLQFSKSTLFRYLKELEEDLASTFDPQSFLLINENNVYAYKSETQIDKSLIVNRLNLYYVKGSIRFKIILALYKKRYTSVDEVANDLYVSPSYLYRQLKDIYTFLDDFHLKINFKPDIQQSTNFVGSEIHLRFFFVYFYWSVFKGIEWPFKRLPESMYDLYYKNEIDKHFPKENLAPAKATQIGYLLTITFWRVNSRKEYIQLDNDLTEILTAICEINDISSSIATTWTQLPENIVTQEKLFFNFFTRIVVASVDSDEMKADIVKHLLTLDSSIIYYCVSFLDELQLYFNLKMTPQKKMINLYYVILYHLYMRYIKVEHAKYLNDPFQLKELNSPVKLSKSLEASLNKFYSQFIKKNHSFNQSDSSKQLTFSLSYFIINSIELEPIPVLVHFSNNISGEYLIKNKINTIFGTSNIRFIDDIDQAFLVISDCYEGAIPNENYFYIEEMHNPIIWKGLFDFIQQHLFNRSFAN